MEEQREERVATTAEEDVGTGSTRTIVHFVLRVYGSIFMLVMLVFSMELKDTDRSNRDRIVDSYIATVDMLTIFAVVTLVVSITCFRRKMTLYSKRILSSIRSNKEAKARAEFSSKFP